MTCAEKDVCLVTMPFADIHMPSMALSLLKACLTRAGIAGVVQYEQLHFIKSFGLKNFYNVQRSHGNFMLGEIVFAKAAHEKTLDTMAGLRDWLISQNLYVGATPSQAVAQSEKTVSSIQKWQLFAEKYIEEAAARVMAYKPKIVAFVSMFQQMNANIALARRLKQEKNAPIILIGGSNCMGDAGIALLEYFEAFDYVFIGEADEIFAEVCAALLRDGEIPPEKFPYGLWSRRAPKPKTLIHRVTKNLDALPVPDFDEFFTTHGELFPERKGKAYLMIEGSRGCWWAQHKPCTFCGLNGFARGYREKNTERLADEIKLLNETYPDARICMFTDSILSQRHTKALPAALKARKVTLQFFTEIKSNLSEDEIAALAEVKFIHLQPGIESLQDDMLRLMNKGCRAIKQIETLKFYRTYNMTLSWNLLCGFPGEREEYMAQIVELMPLLMHLEGPNQIIHIVYHRYGEYTDNTDRYGLSIAPPKVCDFVFPDKDFIERTTYFFEPTDKAELDKYYACQNMGKAYAEAKKIIDIWFDERENPQRLDMYDAGDEINIFDMRNVAVHSAYKLVGLKAQLYRACRRVQSEKSLAKKFPDVSAEKIHDELAALCDDKIMIKIGHEYLALAVDAKPKTKKIALQRRRIFYD